MVRKKVHRRSSGPDGLERSSKVRLCHYCGGRQDRGLKSFKKKARKLVVGHRCGAKWFPYPTISRGE